MKTGSSVKVYVSVLMLEVDHVTLVLRSGGTINKWLLNILILAKNLPATKLFL